MTQHDDSSTIGEAVDTPGKPTSRLPLRSTARRTHRACDRCRVKKSKCNGQQPCATCNANERTCVFSALRRRDIRKWHCHMQDTVDEAIQRLYRACKAGVCFPGMLPDENDGYVTTERILQGMGFTNLDIGPRPTGPNRAGPPYQMPLHQRLITSPDQVNAIGAPILCSGHHVPHIKTDLHPIGPISPTNSADSLHLSDECHVIPATYGVHTPQSNEHTDSEITQGYLRHHHHHHHYPKQQAFDREQQQQQQQQQQQRLYQHEHTREVEVRDTNGHIPMPTLPHAMQGGYAHPLVPFGFVQQYPSPTYYVYDGAGFVNSEPAWSKIQQSG